MREIKFRQAIFLKGVFHHWHYWGYVGYRGEFEGPLTISGVRNEYEVKDSQQYIGIEDKAGLRIYEGDKVKRHNGEIGFVEYQGVSFALKRQGNWRDWEYINWPSEFYGDCEVIGNTTENPDGVGCGDSERA